MAAWSSRPSAMPSLPSLPVTQPGCIPVEGRGETFRTVRAFATLHSEIADAVIARRDGIAANPLASFPTVEDSVLGVTVVNVAVGPVSGLLAG